jgi:presenilin 1
VLVSRAALFDASTFAACFVAVLVGLAGTLFLLSVYRTALPALPISVFGGVAVYVLTRFAIGPPLASVVVSVGSS